MVKDYMNYWTQFSSLLLELINYNKWMTFIFNFFLSVVRIYQFQYIKTVTQIVKDCLARANSKGFSSIAVPDLGSTIGYPAKVLANLLFKAVEEFSKENAGPTLSQVVFCVFKSSIHSVWYNLVQCIRKLVMVFNFWKALKRWTLHCM